MNKILVPTDGSKEAEDAGEFAIANSDISGADIVVLYVIDTSYLDALPQQDLRENIREQLKKEGEEAVNKFRQQMEDEQCEGHCKNVNLTTLLKEGEPADVILKTIDDEDIDQVIMGKSGKHGIDKLVLGSTTDRVVRKSKVPISVIT